MRFPGTDSFRTCFCQAASVGLHMALFVTCGFLITEAAEFGVEAGEGGLVVNKSNDFHAEVEIAENEAIPKEPPTPEPPIVPEPEPPPATTHEPPVDPSPPATQEPAAEPKPDGQEQRAPVPISKPMEKKAAIPRGSTKTATATRAAEKTTSSISAAGAGGAQSARADYLRNPPPPYPAEAKRKKHEGVVQLRVVVGATGKAESVTLLKSSGYRMLDDSARDAVRKWKFHPATVGGVRVSTAVKVPVRFKID